jgi:primosomal protein N''
VFKKLDLHEEFESMDIEHKRITELSDSGGVTKAEINAAWETFEARLNKCRLMQREISSAKGTPPPIPDRFLN